MANFAVLTGNFVTNVIVAETKEIAEQVTNATCIEYTDGVGIGHIYDFETGTFSVPVVEPTE